MLNAGVDLVDSNDVRGVISDIDRVIGAGDLDNGCGSGGGAMRVKVIGAVGSYRQVQFKFSFCVCFLFSKSSYLSESLSLSHFLLIPALLVPNCAAIL